MQDHKPTNKPEPIDTKDRPEPMETHARPPMGPQGKRRASLGREVQVKIGQQLRAYYDGLIEPTPDRFAELLRQLDQPEDKGSAE
jgi:hypothetical protein